VPTRQVKRTAPTQRPQGTAREVDKPKLAEVVAQKIEREIADGGWAVGEVIGSEADLLAKYQVSRAVLREAVRIVEHHFIATMRRGPHGGLVVTEPDVGAIVRTVALQLQFEGIEPRQLYEARVAMELSCVREAAERITPDGIVQLQAFLEHEKQLDVGGLRSHSHDFHVLVAELTGNPALRLFVEILGRLTEQQSVHPPSPDEVDDVLRAHGRIGEAVMAQDAAAAERRMERHLRAVTGWLRSPARAASS
jgi:DNA-binding FadR family transcriptional regulator